MENDEAKNLWDFRLQTLGAQHCNLRNQQNGKERTREDLRIEHLWEMMVVLIPVVIGALDILGIQQIIPVELQKAMLLGIGGIL